MRVVATFVLSFWLAGPLAGGGCLRECPAPTRTAAADACHLSVPGAMFTGTHDCGTHVASARDVVAGTARKDIAPAPGLLVTTFESVVTARPVESRSHVDSSPPIRFLTPLRQ